MKKRKYIDRYLLDFFMQCNSLKELLDVLGSIGVIQDLKYLNRGTKTFKYFRFTFFCLMGRVKTILVYIMFKGEVLKEIYPELNEIYSKLEELKQMVFEVDDLIKSKEMNKSKDKIIEISQEYAKVFSEINKIIEKYT